MKMNGHPPEANKPPGAGLLPFSVLPVVLYPATAAESHTGQTSQTWAHTACGTLPQGYSQNTNRPMVGLDDLKGLSQPK